MDTPAPPRSPWRLRALTAAVGLVAAFAPLALRPVPAAHAQAVCTFQLGFATLRSMVGAATVGDCTQNERFNPANGNAEQPTTRGLLVWRKADNWTAFTNGYETWINAGPRGLVKRLNAQRFSWESDAGAPGTVTIAAPAQAPAPAAPVAPPPLAPAPTGPKAPADPANNGAKTNSAWYVAGFEKRGSLATALYLAYDNNEEWRPIADAAAARGTKVRWGALPAGVNGQYDPATRTITISDVWLETDGYQSPQFGWVEYGQYAPIVAGILTHETYHAAGDPRAAGVNGCYEEEVEAFGWEAATWQRLQWNGQADQSASWAPHKRTPRALARLQEMDALVAAWKAGRLRQHVLASPSYQAQCGAVGGR
jgi:hypothetical protein